MAARFPGMNPYIELSENLWTGFHDVLISVISLQLNATLPQNYTAFVEKRIELVELPDQPLRHRKPDVAVARDFESDRRGQTAVAVLPDIEPAALTLPNYDENPESYIDIRTFPIESSLPVLRFSLHPLNHHRAMASIGPNVRR